MSKKRQSTEAAAAVAEVAKPLDHNQRMRRLAHQRLDQLFDEATRGRFHGRIAIEVTFDDGRAGVVYRKIDGRDK